MKLCHIQERPNWLNLAKNQGFSYANGYWDESKYYTFQYDEIEKVIHPSIQSLYDICMDFVDRTVDNEETLTKLHIPEWFWPRIRSSWKEKSEAYFGRFDLVYDSNSQIKMMEYNAVTPCMLYESGFFQLQWLEDMIAAGHLPNDISQYNSIQDRSLEFFSKLNTGDAPIYFGCVKEADEMLINLMYIINCAQAAGKTCHQIFIDDLQISDEGQLLSPDLKKIDVLFNYYPWEFMLVEENGPLIPQMKTKFIEPEWKMILASKGMLPMLWKEYRGHPNLLPSYFLDDESKPDISGNYVKKPVFSREGCNITIVEDNNITFHQDGPYGADGYIVQEYCPIKKFEDRYPILGGWVINDKACGINIREGSTRVTDACSYFSPHIVIG